MPPDARAVLDGLARRILWVWKFMETDDPLRATHAVETYDEIWRPTKEK